MIKLLTAGMGINAFFRFHHDLHGGAIGKKGLTLLMRSYSLPKHKDAKTS